MSTTFNDGLSPISYFNKFPDDAISCRYDFSLSSNGSNEPFMRAFYIQLSVLNDSQTKALWEYLSNQNSFPLSKEIVDDVSRTAYTLSNSMGNTFGTPRYGT